jgi:hypothetical protein
MRLKKAAHAEPEDGRVSLSGRVQRICVPSTTLFKKSRRPLLVISKSFVSLPPVADS